MKRKNNEEDRSSENGLEKSLLEREPLSGNSVLEMRGREFGEFQFRSSRREEKPNESFRATKFRGNFIELNRVTSDSFRVNKFVHR